jgi:hypothetical protein
MTAILRFARSAVFDSVIGSISGYPIQREFLSKMRDHWF